MTPVLQARLLRTCFARQILIFFSIVSHKSERSPLMMRERVHAVRHTVACLAGVFPPFLLARPSRFSRTQNPLSLHFQTPDTQTTGRHTEKFYSPFPLPPTFGKDLLKRLLVPGMTDLFHSNLAIQTKLITVIPCQLNSTRFWWHPPLIGKESGFWRF